MARNSIRPRTAAAVAGALLVVTHSLTGCVGASDTTASTGSGASPTPHTQTAISAAACPALPDGFVYLNTVDPSIETELRYASTENFTGEIVDGYAAANAVVIREDAAQALASVQATLAEEGFGLLVYDAFRPTRAVADFVAWSHRDDDRTRAEYFPSLEKSQLFALGYIAEQSGHSLGGTVDLTLVDLAGGEPLDMGGTFDLFDERSHYAYADVTVEQYENRTILREVMIDAGFEPYAQEWWHFSYPVPQDAERLDFALEPCG